MTVDRERVPRARTTGLVVRKLDSETLVYDLELERAHCLSDTASQVWRRCDGKTPVSDLAKGLDGLQEELTQARQELVELALAELAEAGLLEGELEPPSPQAVLSRRAAVEELGRIALAPLILTLAQGSLAAQGCSPPPPPGESCPEPGQPPPQSRYSRPGSKEPA